jgi:hypothetical protein
MTDRAEGTEKRDAGGGAGWARRARAWVLWFVVLNALWLVFISAFVVEETVLGMLASAVAATAAVAVGEQEPMRFRPRPAWLLRAWRLPFATVVQSGQVLACLGRQLVRRGSATGQFRVVEVSLPDDPDRALTKAALLVAGESFAPNSFVVAIDRDRGLMLVHELVGRGRR